jgi:hypothetical protein
VAEGATRYNFPFQSFKTFNRCAPFQLNPKQFQLFQPFHRFAPFQWFDRLTMSGL